MGLSRHRCHETLNLILSRAYSSFTANIMPVCKISEKKRSGEKVYLSFVLYILLKELLSTLGVSFPLLVFLLLFFSWVSLRIILKYFREA